MTLRYIHPINKQANLLLYIIISFFAVFYFWARYASIDEVTRAIGRVIPSSQVQVVQNLEGGIVEEILVEVNQVVERGDILLRIDDTGFASTFEEKEERYYSLQARIARLQAEIDGNAPKFSAKSLMEGKKYVANETSLYYAKLDEVDSTISILKQKIRRKEDEIKGFENSKDKIKSGLSLLQEELEMTEPLVNKRIVSEVDMLNLKRELNVMRRELDDVDLSMMNANGEKEEFLERIQEYINLSRRKNIEELLLLKDEYAQITALIKMSKDKVERTTVRSPVRGTVKRILVNTVGGVVKPGMDLVEIIPLEDTLKIEAEVKPRDIAFLRPDQRVLVKISAYDFSVYGGLEAKLERISVDSIRNDNDELVYKILVRTQQNYLGTVERPLPIISGMVADVNIVTGKKTVLDYILKPISKAKNNALKER
tara:strand:- start:37205 stop:38485 length:1281 start_codon:yes stop_codon:yes gene_type:complete